MPKLTPRQAKALERIQNGGTADKGMIAALERKGYLGDGLLARRTVPQKPQSVAARVPQRGGLPDYTVKRWNSLADLRDRIRADGREEIVSFDGVTLTTDRRVFGLAFGELSVSKPTDK